MEYTVIKDLIERKTLKPYAVGDKYPCDDMERAKFLISRGYLAAPEKEPEAEKPEKAEKATKPQKATAKRSTKAKKA